MRILTWRARHVVNNNATPIRFQLSVHLQADADAVSVPCTPRSSFGYPPYTTSLFLIEFGPLISGSILDRVGDSYPSKFTSPRGDATAYWTSAVHGFTSDCCFPIVPDASNDLRQKSLSSHCANVHIHSRLDNCNALLAGTTNIQTRSSANGRESAHLTSLYRTVQKAFQYVEPFKR